MLRTSYATVLLSLFTCGLLLPAEETKTPAEMTTKVFKLPFNFIELSGAVGGQPPASDEPPADPFATAPPRNPLLSEMPPLKSSRKILEETGVEFPPGASALFDPVTQELTVHNTPEAHDLTEAFIDTLSWHGGATTLAFTLTLVEGPGEVIREANAAASSHADATPQLDMLLAEAAKPGSSVQIVGEIFLEAKSGMHATTEAVLERPLMEDFQTTAQAAAAAATAPVPTPPPTPEPPTADKPLETRPSWTRQDGMKLELDAMLDADNKTLAGTVSLHLGPEPPELDNARGRQPAPGMRKASFQAAVNMPDGSTKLIGITKPTGHDKALKAEGKDILQAAFITGRVRHLKSPPGVVAVPDSAQEKLPPGLRAVAFEMPDGLAETLVPEDLMSEFPKGVSMEHRDGRLKVVNTPEHIETIATLVDHVWANTHHNVALTLHTFQVPASLLRPLVRKITAGENVDDSAMLAAVEAAAARGEAKPLRSAFFEGRSGERSLHESGLEHGLLTHFQTTPAPAQRELGFLKQIVGDVLEIEPTVRASGRIVDLVYVHELHPAPPVSHREHLRSMGSTKDHDVPGVELQVLRTNASTTMASGTTKLISLHLAHRGDDQVGPEMLWATFLQAHVVPQARKPKPRPLTKEQAAKARIMEKMNKMIIPEVKFEGVSLEQAVETLRIKSRELDTSTDVESEKGVNLILPPDDFPSDVSIMFDLKDVPFDEALRYVSEVAQKRYLVRAHGVLVVHLHYGMDEMYTRIYRVPPDFLSLSDGDTGTAPPADPFAPAPDANAKTAPRPPKTARSILQAQGITFPEGAGVHFTPTTGMLVVRNTQQNLDLCEAFVGCTLGQGPRPALAFTAQVLQGPGPLLRRIAAQAAPRNDHRAMLDGLLAAVNTGTVHVLDTARIETKSGTRTTTEQGHDEATLSGLVLDGSGGIHPLHEPLFNGLRLKLEPTLGADGVCAGLTLDSEFHTAAPLPRPQHLIDDHDRRIEFVLTDTHRTRLTTKLNILDGHARLLHLWKPTGRPEFEKEDVLQAMFITCEVPYPDE